MYTASGYYMSRELQLRHTITKQHIRIIRLAILVLFLSLSFVFGAMMSAYAADKDISEIPALEDSVSIVEKTYVVQQGDTLWEISKSYLPTGTDIRPFLHDIRTMNNIRSGEIMEGQLLIIPIPVQ